MIKPEVLDALVAAGCTGEQIAAAVKADVGLRSTNAERQARYRAKKASLTVTSNVTERNVTSHASPDKEGPRTPKEINPTEDTPSLRSVVPTSEGPKKAKASRLPADWNLPADWQAWAIAEGMIAAEIDRQATRFRDFWIAKAGKDAAKQDWLATWRNWIRKALDDRPLLRSAPAPTLSDESATLPLPLDSPAYKPLLSRYRFEHGGADPPTNGKTAQFPAAWVQRLNIQPGAPRQ